MKRNKKFVVDANFIKEASNLNLTLNEFLLLLYFENSDDAVLDFDDMTEKLKISKSNLLEAFNSLLSKNVINLIMEKNKDGKRYEKISLENFYNIIKENRSKEEKKNLKEDIFTIFEKEFGKTLSSMEIEVIKSWVEKLYTEELIIAALHEAVYNGTKTIRYIDAVLHEWNKLGFKTKEDVENHMKNKNKFKKPENTAILDYNWLDDNDR